MLLEWSWNLSIATFYHISLSISSDLVFLLYCNLLSEPSLNHITALINPLYQSPNADESCPICIFEHFYLFKIPLEIVWTTLFIPGHILRYYYFCNFLNEKLYFRISLFSTWKGKRKLFFSFFLFSLYSV